MELPENFYKLVEQPGFLKNILYGDTDSIFLTIPHEDAESLSVEDRWKIAEMNAEEINKLIIEYVTGTLLPRCNIDPKHNQTFFKTELLIDAAMFLDVKKNYAYKLSCKEGVVIDPPKVKYTGIQVIKSDAAKLTQKLLASMIEDVMLNTDIKKPDRIKAHSEIVNNFQRQFVNDVNNYHFANIGFPGKWSKRDMFIHGMQIYNFIMQEEIFNIGSAGKFMYCQFHNPVLLKNATIGAMKSPGICVPYEYDAQVLKQKMEQFQIAVDQKLHWSKIFTTSCQRVIDLAKKEVKLFK